ncbi:sulfide/dihydroorotate dehydrogenase-like FAD/NAD-binding protein [Clostridium paridis]|uniref:Sulfide/dihydroorotate dehydrogenase-like FAD/NAD-binding protein n=1 Tax=Clostridium paridis TaxID=2803863 RepID=A0A937FFH6_9CLOT|nr:sulfide/dihydroorotate dehydrogenase-like FAD/NAD-binding protein [Clostridium paridis]MBL4930937.1 sulfide/dihydroorotate dehydrogenase-like FAD/NAD-binding protein [Clostridium paridis]
MKGEKIDCIDSGSKFCPCHLAEANECLLCSQLHGECFCDCLNWKGVCIYQGWIANGSKPKEGRKTYSCKIEDWILLQKDLLLIKFKLPEDLALDLTTPGSFIFLRTDDNFYFDIPISIMECDTDANNASILIEIRGIKTKHLINTKSVENLVIRGPYWNGVFGLKNIKNTTNSKCLILARGIGMAPMIPVIKALKNQGNDLDILIDKEPFDDVYVNDILSNLGLSYNEMSLLDAGKLSDKCKAYIKDSIENNNIKLIHCGGADILTFKVMQYLDTIGEKSIKLSCCNNSKMCCGEGVCGSCTARFAGHRVKRLCKVQADPRDIFEGRRFI